MNQPANRLAAIAVATAVLPLVTLGATAAAPLPKPGRPSARRLHSGLPAAQPDSGAEH